jgi:hypothetical protein
MKGVRLPFRIYVKFVFNRKMKVAQGIGEPALLGSPKPNKVIN